MGTQVVGEKTPHVDRRVERSRRAIKEAFSRLLAERTLDQITVSALAREAGVDRKTFYQHFGSIDGLVDVVVDDAVSRVMDVVASSIKPLAVESPNNAVAAIKAFSHTINVAVRDIMLARHVAVVAPVSLEDITTRVSRSLERELDSRHIKVRGVSSEVLDYCMVFALNGAIGIWRAWDRTGRSTGAD